MENYSKGKNVEEPLARDKIPIPDLPANFLWMQVHGGSKIRNLLSHALNEFPQVNSVVWTGFGPSVGKAITCAEIMKRECGNNLHQITKICYRLTDEYWDPKIPELDQLIVKRKLPMIHIFLSGAPLDSEELGYQGPDSILVYNSSHQNHKRNTGKQTRTPTKELAALGMVSSQRSKRRKKNKNKNRTVKPKDNQQSSSTAAPNAPTSN